MKFDDMIKGLEDARGKPMTEHEMLLFVKM